MLCIKPLFFFQPSVGNHVFVFFQSVVRNFSADCYYNEEIVPVHVSLLKLLFIRLQTCIQIIPSLGLKDSPSQNTEGKKWSLQRI